MAQRSGGVRPGVQLHQGGRDQRHPGKCRDDGVFRFDFLIQKEGMLVF